MAEQHIHLAHKRPGYIGIICTDLSLPEAISFAAQRTKQACPRPTISLLLSEALGPTPRANLTVTACRARQRLLGAEKENVGEVK